MDAYVITTSMGQREEFDVILQGPGLDARGRHFVFRNEERCRSFIEAVNFAYHQGLADGRRQARRGAEEPLWMISGGSPEMLRARPESAGEKLRRWLRERW